MISITIIISGSGSGIVVVGGGIIIIILLLLLLSLPSQRSCISHMGGLFHVRGAI